MYFVYILECKDGSLYTGITTDLTRRLSEHVRGKGARYTRGKKAGVIVYAERKRNRSTASKREAEIKSWTRSEKLTLVRDRATSKRQRVLVRELGGSHRS
jgi:putative endonuclease